MFFFPFKINIILNFSVCSMRSAWSSVPSFNISIATLSTQTDRCQSRKTDTGSELSVKPPATDSRRSSGCHVSYLFSCWSLCSSWRQTEAPQFSTETTWETEKERTWGTAHLITSKSKTENQTSSYRLKHAVICSNTAGFSPCFLNLPTVLSNISLHDNDTRM